MQTIIIKLNSNTLANPDTDLFYMIPNRLEELSNGAIQDNGYDYFDNQQVGIWLQAESAVSSAQTVIKMLQEETLLENQLSASAEVFISSEDTANIDSCTKIFPQ